MEIINENKLFLTRSNAIDLSRQKQSFVEEASSDEHFSACDRRWVCIYKRKEFNAFNGRLFDLFWYSACVSSYWTQLSEISPRCDTVTSGQSWTTETIELIQQQPQQSWDVNVLFQVSIPHARSTAINASASLPCSGFTGVWPGKPSFCRSIKRVRVLMNQLMDQLADDPSKTWMIKNKNTIYGKMRINWSFPAKTLLRTSVLTRI